MTKLLDDLHVLSQGTYLQLVTKITLLDDAIIRSNEPEEVLTYFFKNEALKNRFIIPWRKVKGKVRRSAMEAMRGNGIHAECHLKENLCMKCPCCVLFGGTGDVSSAKVGYNLLSRVLGDTFISTEEVDTINSYTANAVDEKTLSTGQALMTLVKVPAETAFLGVVTLRDPTKESAAIIIDALERTTRIGASTREWGRCKTTVEGYSLADRETLASYELASQVPSNISDLKKLKRPSDIKKAYTDFGKVCSKILKEFDGKKKGNQMILFRFRITLYDPLFYAREGLSAAVTPKILHATAINHAVCAARGDNVVNQPFVIADINGGMDTPRYKNSCVNDQFYFSPASIVGAANDWPEIVKGDNEGFFFKVKAGEILKATRWLFIAPETQFVGLGVAKAKSVEFPERIRLGSFRGVARMETESANKFKSLALDTAYSVDHPVDPLVSDVDRGVMHNMFPYPLVENPMCKNVYEASFERPLFGRKKARFAWPRGIDQPRKLDRIKTGPSAII